MAELRPVRAFPGWVWWVLLAMPALFVIAGLVMLADTARFLSRAERAEATVVSVARIGGADSASPSGAAYLPTLAYADAAGARHEAVTYIPSAGYDYAPGTVVPIYYDPAAADGEVRIAAGLFALWGLPAMFLALGALFIGIVEVFRRRVAASAAASAAARRG